MPYPIIEDVTFFHEDFGIKKLCFAQYENCRFENCNFEGQNLSQFRFLNCEFLRCNLSLTDMQNVTLQGDIFKECKMLGMRFDLCNPFNLSFTFHNCLLDHSSFYKTVVKKTIFQTCELKEVDFEQCNLTQSVFDNCNLLHSKFFQSILEKVDFRSAYNYTIDPDNNKLKKAKFSLVGVPGLLEKYDININ
ncbi:pentapeptide repeat-containing protein [Sphingobacterium alkalisoli]|uniref:Pentapeptide repeat-containing protein n=1 Tax=Sphingobacterium alkalisoli TaxID=1874115 RepID=A0A4U0H569_9SPHI|nr:pentapeptide repeat-containing protein [Sphingobacterium alkalisoli]TJY66883.1 pentapeptide repeat-containing protein [Sphingobacterium alkalisoli]GGH13621.1 hypothetical protein GCM10011418_13980 [Sphingobacterium alkalisoli]